MFSARAREHCSQATRSRHRGIGQYTTGAVDVVDSWTHSKVDDGVTGRDRILPRQRRAAIELIEQHPDQHLPLSVVAAQSGIGVRALQAGVRHARLSNTTTGLRTARDSESAKAPLISAKG